ncbi:hypothetical protein Q4R42_13480 [Morganella morganii subsp. sibonii]
MTAIVFPHVCCNDGIITDLSGYGCIPGNLGLPEKYQPKGNYAGTRGENIEQDSFRVKLGIKSAGLRDVGSGSGQLPDMSYFNSANRTAGYQKLPSGLIIQWGAGNAGVGSAAGTGNEIMYPVSFPNLCFQIIATYDNGGSVVTAGAAGGMTTDSFLLRCAASSGNYNFRWLAIGY